MEGVPLNGPVRGSVATPSGNGYYMVASDGGIFAFGDAAFHGSMGAQHLNAPVVGLAPDPDGNGYWLVASDGGIFAFDAPFKGSMGRTKLNKPVVGMVAYGDGYLLVAADGGIFNFSTKPFAGSLGASPPAQPIVAVSPMDD
jgi:ribosomal protein L24E